MEDLLNRMNFGGAEALVRETLARHGLSPDMPRGPVGTHGLTGFRPPMAARGAHRPPPGCEVPAGATFRHGRFECPHGARDYRTFVPSTSGEGVRGLLVMLHGCTQTSEDFALGTAMNAHAEREGLVVIYPQQARGENAQSCWNWFRRGDRMRDRGEPAIIAGIARQALADFRVPSDAVFVAGLSAGAAMAVILGETYPDLFTGVAAHSGLPFGAAHDVPSAYRAMAGEVLAHAPASKIARMIVFHGLADATVAPTNGARIAETLVGRGQTVTETRMLGGRRVDIETLSTGENPSRMEHWRIEGLGHAWSGGDARGSHVDPRGPDASAEILRFFLGARP